MTYRAERIVSIFIKIFSLGILAGAMHKSQTKDFCKAPICKISFKEFRRLFEQREWKMMSNFPRSIESGNWPASYSHIHASIYMIDNKGYLLTPIGLIRAQIMIGKLLRELRKKRGPIFIRCEAVDLLEIK